VYGVQKTILYPGIGEVTLSRTRRSKRIVLSVRPGGKVLLSFPLWTTQRQALDFLDRKIDWVEVARLRIAAKYPSAGAGDSDGSGDFDEADRAAGQAARERAREALRAEAGAKLPAMVARLAAEHGFSHGAVRIKATRSRWGSCTPRNDINLSLALAALPDHLAEYIVLHELCHTVHRNHSARFHALLDSVTGGRSRSLNRELKAYRPETLVNP
jgi:predicted metal-dependent hydrolase